MIVFHTFNNCFMLFSSCRLKFSQPTKSPHRQKAQSNVGFLLRVQHFQQLFVTPMPRLTLASGLFKPFVSSIDSSISVIKCSRAMFFVRIGPLQTVQPALSNHATPEDVLQVLQVPVVNS